MGLGYQAQQTFPLSLDFMSLKLGQYTEYHSGLCVQFSGSWQWCQTCSLHPLVVSQASQVAG